MLLRLKILVVAQLINQAMLMLAENTLEDPYLGLLLKIKIRLSKGSEIMEYEPAYEIPGVMEVHRPIEKKRVKKRVIDLRGIDVTKENINVIK